MAEQVYVKNIVMQQLRKVTWANGDPVASGQIAIKLSNDSSKVEEVRVGTEGGTWGTADKLTLEGKHIDGFHKSLAATVWGTDGKEEVSYNGTAVADLGELYSADKVDTLLLGKEATGTAAGLIQIHNEDAAAHKDIREDIAKLKEDIKNTTNLMNFRGVFISTNEADVNLTNKEEGDVIVLSDGKEYVWAQDAKGDLGWVELGDTSANTQAIADLQGNLGVLGEQVQSISTQQSTNNAAIKALQGAPANSIDQTDITDWRNAAIQTNTNKNAIATLNGDVNTDGSVKKIAKSYADTVLGASTDAATANTVHGVKNAVTAAVSRIDTLEDNSLTAVKAGAGISISNATALQPEVSLAEVADDSTLQFQFSVFKVDRYGRVVATAPITVLDGNA